MTSWNPIMQHMMLWLPVSHKATFITQTEDVSYWDKSVLMTSVHYRFHCRKINNNKNNHLKKSNLKVSDFDEGLDLKAAVNTHETANND